MHPPRNTPRALFTLWLSAASAAPLGCGARSSLDLGPPPQVDGVGGAPGVGGNDGPGGGVPCEPSEEVCDGVDNNCDGLVDEDTCPRGTTCSARLSADMASPPPDWLFNGTAYWDGATRTAVLTEARQSEAGTLIYRTPIEADAFTARFQFRLGAGDGMGFMLQTTGNDVVGGRGGGLGMVGLEGYAIELDTYDNGFNGGDCSDPDANHVGLDDLLRVCDPAIPGSLVFNSAPVFLGDGSFHQGSIQLERGVVSVTLDGVPALDAMFSGPSPDQRYFFGFSAANGAAFDRQEIRDIEVVFPTFRCL